jgi:hypothetical protein
MKPIGDRVLVQALEEKELKKRGIIMPDTSKEKPQGGTVVAVGTGKLDNWGARGCGSVWQGLAKLICVLNYVWLLVVFPAAVAILVGVLGHSANLGFKTFLLIECGMAVLSPLLNAVLSDGNHTHRHRRK